MSCTKCMDYKPNFYGDTFTCPKCGQKWVLANVHPGNYWQTAEQAQADKQRTDEIVQQILKNKKLK